MDSAALQVRFDLPVRSVSPCALPFPPLLPLLLPLDSLSDSPAMWEREGRQARVYPLIGRKCSSRSGRGRRGSGIRWPGEGIARGSGACGGGRKQMHPQAQLSPPPLLASR